MRAMLKAWCRKRGYDLVEEYRFHPTRKWQADWFIPQISIAIEYEGLFSQKSRHTTITGYSGDTDKYRAMVLQGIRCLRYTAMNYGQVETDLDEMEQKF